MISYRLCTHCCCLFLVLASSTANHLLVKTRQLRGHDGTSPTIEHSPRARHLQDTNIFKALRAKQQNTLNELVDVETKIEADLDKEKEDIRAFVATFEQSAFLSFGPSTPPTPLPSAASASSPPSTLLPALTTAPTTQSTTVTTRIPSTEPTTSTQPPATPTIAADPSSELTMSTQPSASPTVAADPSSEPTTSAQPSDSPTVAATLSSEPTASGEPSISPTLATITSSDPTASVSPSSFPTVASTAPPTTNPTLRSTTTEPTAAPSTMAPTSPPTDIQIPVISTSPTSSPTSQPAETPADPASQPDASPVNTTGNAFDDCGLTPEQRVFAILDALDAVADPDLIRDNTAPQGMATTWLIEDDLRRACPDDPKFVQRWVMAVTYFSTGGDDWFQCSASPTAADSCGATFPFVGESRFLSSNSECDWAGITCIDGCVTEIEFEENNLEGTIPTEIGLLSDLAIWGMERGNLTSTIPTEIASLTNLIFLDLDFNSLTGSITSELLSLTSLTQLDINNNLMTGSINGIGVFPNMTFMQLNDNFFTGTIPDTVGSFSNLVAFTVHETSVSGIMPSSICELRDDAGNGGVLESLIADCNGPNPNVNCTCCTDCRDP